MLMLGGLLMLGLGLLLGGAAAGAIDRAAVVARHTVTFSHPAAVDAAATAHNTLTVGNGELAFGADLTGLQSLNNSFHTPGYPLYTLSNWGWHTPDPKLLGAKQPMFRADGTLNYAYENVTINSSDTRPGKGNRTVPYQFNCAKYNDPALCSYQHNWPARASLGQLSFVLPKHAQPSSRDEVPPAAVAAPRAAPFAGCSGVGTWCNAHEVQKDHASGGWSCKQLMTVAPNSSAQQPAGCNETASCLRGWQGLPFCLEPSGEIEMQGLHPGVHHGYFDGSCDRIKWNNSFDSSSWCRADSAACNSGISPPPPPGDNQPAGDYRFLELPELSKTSQSLDMYTGLLESNWTHTDKAASKTHTPAPNAVQVVTAVDADSDTVSSRFTAPRAMNLAIQLAFCTVSKHGGACEWEPFGSPNGPLEDHTTTILNNHSDGTGKGRLDLFRENGADTYSVSCTWSGEAGLTMQRTAEHTFVLQSLPATASKTDNENETDIQNADGKANDGVTTTTELSCRFQLNCCVGTTPRVPKADLSAKVVPAVAVSMRDLLAHSLLALFC